MALLLAGLLSAARAYGSWSTGYYRQADAATMPPAEIHFAALTHVIHAHVAPKDDGGVETEAFGITPEASAALVSAAHRNGVKALLDIANTWPRGTEFTGATSPEHLDTFIGNLISLMQSRGYDGIDIDWEPLRNSELPRFVSLVKGLRAAMDKITPRPVLTAALWHQEATVATLQDCLDQVNIMTYDMARTGVVTWHNAPLHAPDGNVGSVETSMQRWIKAGIPPAKLGTGMPFYGWVWQGGAGMPNGGATAPQQRWTTEPKLMGLNYNKIMLTYYGAPYERWDALAQVPYLSIDKEGSDNDVFVTYDSPASIMAKVGFAKEHGFGGWIIWDLSADYFPEQPTMAQKHPLAEAVRLAMGGR